MANPSPAFRSARHQRQVLAGLALVALLTLIVRAALPSVARAHLNEKLEPYGATVGDLDLHLWRAAITAKDIAVTWRHDVADLDGTIASCRVELSLRSLLDRQLRWSLHVTQPRLTWTQRSLETEELALPTPVDLAVPAPVAAAIARIQTARFQEGTFVWHAPGRVAGFALRTRDIAFDYTTDPDTVNSAVATFRGVFADGGDWQITAENLSLYPDLRVEVGGQIRDFPLPSLNPILRESLGVEAARGDVRIEFRVHADHGFFAGYFQPAIVRAEIRRLPKDNVLSEVWARSVEMASRILENNETRAVAAQIPFSGRLRDAEADQWTALRTLIGNAFGDAIWAGTRASLVRSPRSAANDPSAPG